ncbi:MAG: SDR family NAD(P)-dependent oxidoreductase [Spirochaetaceae bacterium]
MSKIIETVHLSTVIENYSQNMNGQVVAITGTTSGTGYVAARVLADKGAEVILLNRISGRATASLSKLKNDVPDGKFTQIECDLQSLVSVNNAIDEINSKYKVIDILCNNAGVMAFEDYATADGYDVQIQTNVISHFQLFKGLLPLLVASKEARVISHTSGARRGGPLQSKYFGKNGGNLGGNGTDEDNSSFQGPRWERYHQTKLANFVFTYALKEKLAQKNITNIKSLAAHPGLAATNLQITTAETGGMDIESEIMKSAQSSEDGATGIIRASMDKNAKSGDFFGPEGWGGYPKNLTPEADLITKENMEIFWQNCEVAVGKVKF